MNDAATSIADEIGSRWKPYPVYKDSGTEWLGKVPAHWEVFTVKRYAKRIQTGTTPPTVQRHYYEDGNVPWFGPGSFDEDIELKEPTKFISEKAVTDGVARIFDVGSAMIVTIGATIGKVGYISIPASSNQQITAVSFDTRYMFPKYAAYQIKRLEPVLRGIAPSTTLPILDQEEIGYLPLILPTISEQHIITSFLDRETAHIDTLIAKKERLIDFLTEKRSALISHAVTKGLEPTVTMKDSGVEWLGEIPAHWEAVALKRTARRGFKTFTDGDWIEAPYIQDDGIRLVQTGNIGIGEFKEQGFRYISEETFWNLRCTEVFPGDVLVCRLDGPVGRACLAPNLGVRMVTSVDNAILKPAEDYDSRFLVYFMMSRSWLDWIQSICRVGGGFRFRISRSMLGDLKVTLPPTNEQRRIADCLDDENEKIRRLITKVHAHIEKLKEYRTALISAAVTGKIDVRSEVA